MGLCGSRGRSGLQGGRAFVARVRAIRAKAARASMRARRPSPRRRMVLAAGAARRMQGVVCARRVARAGRSSSFAAVRRAAAVGQTPACSRQSCAAPRFARCSGPQGVPRVEPRIRMRAIAANRVRRAGSLRTRARRRPGVGPRASNLEPRTSNLEPRTLRAFEPSALKRALPHAPRPARACRCRPPRAPREFAWRTRARADRRRADRPSAR
ncbi:hypothetical protein X946_894 [Burkholderia sp. ABCPW 111]|nr:hypothetical protein X946_894 [Burkholderia sp. ABCPW 111]